MSSKEKNSPEVSEANEKATGSFVQENSKSLLIIGGAILALILLYIGYQKFYLAPRAEKAVNEMFKAEQYSTADSLSDKAINGDGSYPGFEKIAEEYTSTKSANIANAYLGGLYLKKGEFEKAIEALGNYSSTGSPVIDPLVLGMLGDAYSELKDYDNAATYYKKAAGKSNNEFTTPLFLKKLGLVYEQQKKFDDALKSYKQIKENYTQSAEAATIESLIARVEVQQ